MNVINGSVKKKELDKTTLLSFIGIGVLLILIAIPPVLRLMNPKPVEVEDKKEIVKVYLDCSKNEIGEDYIFLYRIKSTYEDSTIIYTEFSFEVSQKPGSTRLPLLSEMVSEELNSLSNLTDTNIKTNKTNVKETYEFDYKKYDFSKITLLNDHKKVLQSQVNIYRTDGYTCGTTSEVIQVNK